MKPIRLVLNAFGPYAGRQIIDFRELAGKTFFLIHGRTGGGKTSLLDAMCYALYGETSGAERDGKDMRSHHADPLERTAVTFDFSIGYDSYRVSRSPQQERPRKRGGGMTLESSQATLWRRTGLTDDHVDGAVLAAQPGKATEAVEKLLGFASNQFRQVVVLPQGKFRQLLIAESAEKEKILETLFKTEIYRRIEESLKDAAKEIRRSWSDARICVETLLSQAGVSSVDELREQTMVCAMESHEAQQAIDVSRRRLQEAQEKLDEGRQAAEKLDELSVARLALEQLQGQKESFEQKRLQFKRAQDACKFTLSESNLAERKKDLDVSSGKLSAAREALKRASLEMDGSKQLLQEELDKQPQQESLRRELHKLEELACKVKDLKIVNDQLLEFKKAEETLTQQSDSLLEQTQKYEILLAEKQEVLVETQLLAATLDNVVRIAQGAKTQLSMRKALDKSCDLLKQSIVDAEAGRVALAQAEADFKGKKADLTQLERAWLSGQAAILASTLKDNEQCPVCGAINHPAPALSAGPLPTHSELETTAGKVEDLQAAKDNAGKQYSKLQAIVTGLESQVSTLTETLGDDAVTDIATLQQRLRESELCISAAEKATGRLDEVRRQIAQLNDDSRSCKQEKTTVDKQLNEASESCSRLSGIVAEKTAAIPGHLAEANTLEKHQLSLQDSLHKMERALEGAQVRAGDAERSLAVCHTDLHNADEQLCQARTSFDRSSRNFERQLQEAGFASNAVYQAAKMTPEGIYKLDEEIRSFFAGYEAACQRLSRAELSARWLIAPLLFQLESNLQDAGKANEEAVARSSQMQYQLKNLNVMIEKLEAALAEKAALEKHYEAAGKIADVAAGDNARKLTFQRFVLCALLDDVLLAASEHLAIMSQGRYCLQRVAGVTDLRKAGGLELEVFDSYTGTTRGVATLSGGESFLASLSLALGLADVVQSYAGGIHLETMFIDEGFGSLDCESLDLAVRALRDLQKEGRLVGIISHVPELRERIDTRLEILPSGQGSMARFCVA